MKSFAKVGISLLLLLGLLATSVVFTSCPPRPTGPEGPEPPTEPTDPTPQKEYYTVVFHVNTNDPANTLSFTQEFERAVPTPILPRPANFVFDGYGFKGWSSDPSATTPEYLDAQMFSPTASMDLYAVWGAYRSVVFDAADGEGNMEDQEFVDGIPAALSANSFTRSGYGFAGWGFTKGGDVEFEDEAEINVHYDSNIDDVNIKTLYAIWRKLYMVTYHSNNGSDVTITQEVMEGVPTDVLENEFAPEDEFLTFAGWTDWVGSGDVADLANLGDDDLTYVDGVNSGVTPNTLAAGQVGGITYFTPAYVKKLQTLDDIKHLYKTKVTVTDDIHLYAVWKGFRKIDVGTFIMGGLGNGKSKVPHEVTLTRGFYCATNEVTQKEFRDYVQYTQEQLGADTFVVVADDHPVVNISWFQAIVYCNRRSYAEGLEPAYKITSWPDDPDEQKAMWMALDFSKLPVRSGTWSNSLAAFWQDLVCDFDAEGYRLPTEAEYEYVARRHIPTSIESMIFPGYGVITDYSVYNLKDEGKDAAIFDYLLMMSGLYAVTDKSSIFGTTSYVMSKRSNSDKIYDLSGNVNEFVWDLITADPSYSSDPLVDPVNFTTNFNIARQFNKGGAWDSVGCSQSVVSTGRENDLVGKADLKRGFRVVRTAK